MRFITKKHLPRRTFLRGLGVAISLSAAGFHGAGADAAGEDRGQSAAPAGILLHPARRGDGQLDSHRAKAPISSCRERSCPLEPFRDQVVVVSELAHKNAAPGGPGDNGGDHTRSPAVFLNGVHPKRTDGADIQRGHDHRSDRRAEDRPGDAAAFARTGYRGLQRAGRLLRRGLQLRLHEHHFLAHAHHAAAHGDQSPRGLRPPVRRRGHGRGALGTYRPASAAFWTP